MSPSLEMESLDVIVEVKVSSYWRGAGCQSHMTGVLRGRGGRPRRGLADVTRQGAWRTAGRRQRRTLPQRPKGRGSCQHPDFGPLASRT